jgi:hypothetical protein
LSDEAIEKKDHPDEKINDNNNRNANDIFISIDNHHRQQQHELSSSSSSVIAINKVQWIHNCIGGEVDQYNNKLKNRKVGIMMMMMMMNLIVVVI